MSFGKLSPRSASLSSRQWLPQDRECPATPLIVSRQENRISRRAVGRREANLAQRSGGPKPRQSFPSSAPRANRQAPCDQDGTRLVHQPGGRRRIRQQRGTSKERT